MFRKPLEIEAWFHYGVSNGHVTDDVTWPRKRPRTLRAQYLENSWRCYLATIANELLDSLLLRSAILATTWLLV